MAPSGLGHSTSVSMTTTNTDSEMGQRDSSRESSYAFLPSSCPSRSVVTGEEIGASWTPITSKDLSSSTYDPERRRDLPLGALVSERDLYEKEFACDEALVGEDLEKSVSSSNAECSSPVDSKVDSKNGSDPRTVASRIEFMQSTGVGVFNPAWRSYTASLGTSALPTNQENGRASKLSIISDAVSDAISDAGDQQQLRQHQSVASNSVGTTKEIKNEERRGSFQDEEDLHELQTEIFDALVETRKTEICIPDLGFLPKAQLNRLVNPKSVARELAKDKHLFHTHKEIRRYAEEICRQQEVEHAGKKKIKTFRKIFALLVLVEAASSISLFLESDVSDLDLPLATVRHRGKREFRRKDSAGQPLQEPLECFQHSIWSPVKVYNFGRYQWSMLAPYFSPDKYGEVKHYLLHDQHILPFVASHDADDDDAEYHGGYGKVFMVRIHDEQHNFHDKVLSQRGFAVKQLYKNDRESFKREFSILRMFSGERSHRHVVSLLATYEQYNKYHFIFYRAEGDLFKYWKELKTSPPFTYRNVLWLAEQWAGIAEGLSKLHKHLTWTIRRMDSEEPTAQKSAGEKRVNFVAQHRRKERTDSNGVREQCPSPTFAISRPRGSWDWQPRRQDHPRGVEEVRDVVERYGRHGDINPGNILWYDNGAPEEKELKGTLKISDFGQAELNSQFSRTRQRSVANTMTYRPPECDLQPKTIRQSYDIWCLGCVYLEFVAWFLGGETLLTDFAKKRLTPDVFMNNQPTDTFFQVVKTSTSEYPQVMVKKKVTQFIHELHAHPNCTDYFHDILNLVQYDMLVVESKERMACEGVMKKLLEMYAKCRHDNDYATKRSPWPQGSLQPQSLPIKVEMTEDAEQVINQNLRSLVGRPRKPKGKVAPERH